MEPSNKILSNGSSQTVSRGNIKSANGISADNRAFDSRANLHTDSVQEIMTKPPAWILRWGIAIFFSILLMFLAISNFLYFPETINTEMQIRSTDIVTKIFSPSPGMITRLFVNMGDTVKKGQPLLLIERVEISGGFDTLYAPQTGRVMSAAIIDKGYNLNAGEEVLVIHSGNAKVYGIIEISAVNISNIKLGQDVLISLNDYEGSSGKITGKINHISNEPVNGKFMVSVDINYSRQKNQIELTSLTNASAKIVIRKTTILNRLLNKNKLVY